MIESAKSGETRTTTKSALGCDIIGEVTACFSYDMVTAGSLFEIRLNHHIDSGATSTRPHSTNTSIISSAIYITVQSRMVIARSKSIQYTRGGGGGGGAHYWGAGAAEGAGVGFKTIRPRPGPPLIFALVMGLATFSVLLRLQLT